ncbi:hypothetical protein [Clostridium baratii]|uniref:hypothetical protein n=1 Tax=Clostridium baratii TaxID=1561 RepID=UPI0030D22958
MDRKEIYSMVEYCKSEEGGLCGKCPHSTKCSNIGEKISNRCIRMSTIPEQWNEKEIDIIENLYK